MIYSYSRLKKYEDCPSAFFRKYVLGLSEIPGEAAILGKATHRAIELRLLGNSLRNSVDLALSEAEMPVNRDDIIKFITHPKVENMRKNSLKKVEYHFELPLEKNNPSSPIIQGYIDLWWEDFLEVSLLDWKTNRKKYSPRANHQLGLYAWALNQITGNKHINAALVFLRYNTMNCCEIKDYSLNDMEEARNWALSLANKIEASLKEFFAKSHKIETPFFSNNDADTPTDAAVGMGTNVGFSPNKDVGASYCHGDIPSLNPGFFSNNNKDAPLQEFSPVKYLSDLSNPYHQEIFPATPGSHCNHCSYAILCQNE